MSLNRRIENRLGRLALEKIFKVAFKKGVCFDTYFLFLIM